MLSKLITYNKVIYSACFLSGLVFFSLFFYSNSYNYQPREEEQYHSRYTSIAVLDKDTISDLDIEYRHADNNPLNIPAKEVIPAASEASVANISYTPKTQKNTTAALIKHESVSKSYKIYLNSVNTTPYILDFDSFAGFMIHKQLKTNA